VQWQHFKVIINRKVIPAQPEKRAWPIAATGSDQERGTPGKTGTGHCIQPAKFKFPRRGAFEVAVYDESTLSSAVVFSKYKQHEFPVGDSCIWLPLARFLFQLAVDNDRDALLTQLSEFCGAHHIYVRLLKIAERRSESTRIGGRLTKSLRDLDAKARSGEPSELSQALQRVSFNIKCWEVQEAEKRLAQLNHLLQRVQSAAEKLDRGYVQIGCEEFDILMPEVDASGLQGPEVEEAMRKLHAAKARNEGKDRTGPTHSLASLTDALRNKGRMTLQQRLRVQDQFKELEQQVAALKAERDAALAQVAPAQEELERLRAERDAVLAAAAPSEEEIAECRRRVESLELQVSQLTAGAPVRPVTPVEVRQTGEDCRARSEELDYHSAQLHQSLEAGHYQIQAQLLEYSRALYAQRVAQLERERVLAQVVAEARAAPGQSEQLQAAQEQVAGQLQDLTDSVGSNDATLPLRGLSHLVQNAKDLAVTAAQDAWCGPGTDSVITDADVDNAEEQLAFLERESELLAAVASLEFEARQPSPNLKQVELGLERLRAACSLVDEQRAQQVAQVRGLQHRVQVLSAGVSAM